MNLFNNLIILVTAGFLSTSFGSLSSCTHNEAEEAAIKASNASFSTGLKNWGCIEFTIRNNLKTECTIRADDLPEVKVGAGGNWNFPGRGFAYSSILLRSGCGVFHIDERSACGTKHTITIDKYRGPAEIAAVAQNPTNATLKDLLREKMIQRFQLENYTDQECVVRINQCCECRVAPKCGNTPSAYFFDPKPCCHHAVELLEGNNVLMNLIDLGQGAFKITLNPDPAAATIAASPSLPTILPAITAPADQQVPEPTDATSLVNALLPATLTPATGTALANTAATTVTIAAIHPAYGFGIDAFASLALSSQLLPTESVVTEAAAAGTKIAYPKA